MNVTNTNSLNLKTDDVSGKTASNKNNDANFSEELKNIKTELKKPDEQKVKKEQEAQTKQEIQNKQQAEKNTDTKKFKESIPINNQSEDPNIALVGLNDTIDALNKLTQKDETDTKSLKEFYISDDIKDKKEVFGLIDNNINLQEQQDKFNVQTGTNMNFSSDGQPFTEFINQENSKKSVSSSSKDLAEEQAILSTMEENIAIANKNMAMAKTKTVENEHGIHKIDKKTNLVVDTIVNYNNVVMDKADVEFFANLVENGFLNMNEVAKPQKSAHVSKTLADLLAKAMNDNKPIRIDFDNNISVIIKIDRAGKISADFLPSSQVAEAYLKENLPLLRQRFDENNIDYNELNQRQRKQDTQDNRKKERKDE